MPREVDPFAMLRELEAKQESAQQKSEEVRRTRNEYHRHWDDVIKGPNVENLMQPGEQLSNRGCRFWLDIYRLNISQHFAAVENAGHEDTVPNVDGLTFLIAVKIMIVACEGQESEVGRLFDEAIETPYVNIQRGLDDLWNEIRMHEGGSYPATPHMTRKYLAQAVKGISGLSNPQLTRMIKNGYLREEAKVGEQKIGYWCRFSFIKTGLQLRVLKAVKEHLEENSEKI